MPVHTFDVGTTDAGAVYGWTLEGQPQPVAAEDLTDVQGRLDGLTPADRSGGCTADLGPRWMVVYSPRRRPDRSSRRRLRLPRRSPLTDDPRTTPPGADDQDGTVGGVLDGGPDPSTPRHRPRQLERAAAARRPSDSRPSPDAAPSRAP